MPHRFAAVFLSAALCIGGSPGFAQEAPAVDHAALRERALGVLEAQFGGFRAATATLEDSARAYCGGTADAANFTDAFRAAWLAWAPLDAYQFGPVEQSGAVLGVAFWPDKKDFVGRALRGFLSLPPEAQANPATVAQQSAAVHGLPAIERLLAEEEMPDCPAVIGISAYLHETGTALYDGWFASGGWADLARAAGPDNPVYLSEAEFTKVIFTAADFEMSRIADMRLGRPLGTFDRPYPRRAEAWRAGLSLDIVDAALAGLGALLDEGFGPAVTPSHRAIVDDAIAKARARIPAIGAPLDEAVADPMTRIRVEDLQSRVNTLRALFNEDIGPGLGVETGFSAADGD